MSNYPATTLAKNKNKYYVLLTIPPELRQHFNGRKQLKRSTGTSDLADAKRRQHDVSSGLYAQLDACKPDLRDASDLLGWIGDADETQRLENENDLEGIIMSHKYMEYKDDPANDWVIDEINKDGTKALEVYREWKAKQNEGNRTSGAVYLSVASQEYLATEPYGPVKTTRDCELSLQFQDFVGDMALTEVTPVLVHQYAEHIGQSKSRETVAKKIGYVRRLFDHSVRKGWLPSNVFLTAKLDKNIGKKRPLVRTTLDEGHKFGIGIGQCACSNFVSAGITLHDRPLWAKTLFRLPLTGRACPRRGGIQRLASWPGHISQAHAASVTHCD